ncbi:rCG52575 [Rattus norvegicus]|uniref:RCG52575 n=1 Tax=Rattus norvegicus TaxID=10116 RepID=A6IQZ6_RAT|nr:rCG52575 [Rattus norvegicus]
MLMSDKAKVWENVGTVEWAGSIVYAEVIAKVKVLLVGYLANNVTEEILETLFIQFGELEQVKKLKHYAFRHFEAQDSVVKAMEEMNAKYLERQKY